MIIARLGGGLGNQMFQYANARNYQRSANEKILLDTRHLKEWNPDIEKQWQKPFALDIFKGLRAQRINESWLKLLNSDGLINYIKGKFFAFNVTNVFQQEMQIVPHKKIKTKYVYLGGNFQSELYFKNLRNELLEEYRFPLLDDVNEATKQRILSSPDALSIHIRRGDYLATANQAIFDSVNLEYYSNAVNELVAATTKKQFDAFVFTDDVSWAKENFKYDNLNLNYVEGNYSTNSWKDMCLMSCCKHHIIANSSFSWWGAWLSERQGLKMAPRYWYKPRTYTYNISDVVPATWKIIDYNPDF